MICTLFYNLQLYMIPSGKDRELTICLLKIPQLIKERTLVDEVNTVLFYLTLLGWFYVAAKYTQATFTIVQTSIWYRPSLLVKLLAYLCWIKVLVVLCLILYTVKVTCSIWWTTFHITSQRKLHNWIYFEVLYLDSKLILIIIWT